MKTWADRAKSQMKELGMTQEVLANKLGITQGAITHYLSGRRAPPLRKFQKLAAALKVDAGWLLYGNESASITGKDAKKENNITEQAQNQVPILTWEQAVDSLKALQRSKNTAKDFLPYFHADSSKWYALRIKGDSMISPLGNKNNFQENDIIIVDPEKTAEHGSYVVAALPRSKEATFKQFIIDSGERYLKPLNPQYPIVAVDKNTHICGVVIACITTFS